MHKLVLTLLSDSEITNNGPLFSAIITESDQTTRCYPCWQDKSTQGCFSVGPASQTVGQQQSKPVLTFIASCLTQYIDIMLDRCLDFVVDDGPSLSQHWINVACLFGYKW